MRLSLKAWQKKFAEYLTPDNAYFDSETQTTLYRGAAYCLCCRLPVMEVGTFCPNCSPPSAKHSHPHEKGELIQPLKT